MHPGLHSSGAKPLLGHLRWGFWVLFLVGLLGCWAGVHHGPISIQLCIQLLSSELLLGAPASPSTCSPVASTCPSLGTSTAISSIATVCSHAASVSALCRPSLYTKLWGDKLDLQRAAIQRDTIVLILSLQCIFFAFEVHIGCAQTSSREIIVHRGFFQRPNFSKEFLNIIIWHSEMQVWHKQLPVGLLTASTWEGTVDWTMLPLVLKSIHSAVWCQQVPPAVGEGGPVLHRPAARFDPCAGLHCSSATLGSSPSVTLASTPALAPAEALRPALATC